MTAAPSRLEYGTGFDLAAGWLGGAAYPLLAVVSTPEFVDQVVLRLEGPVVFACDDARTHDHASWRLSGGELPVDLARRCAVWPAVETAGPPGRPAGGAFRAALWAAPQAASWATKLAAIGGQLDPGGRLCVLTGTAVAALTRPLRANRVVGEPGPLAATLRGGLGAAGWEVLRVRGVGGLGSAGWAVAGRLAALGGRPDVADRAERAHHLAVESGTGASYAVLLAGRPAGAPPPEAP